MSKYLYIVVFVVFVTFCNAIPRPSYISACNRNDPNLNQCAIESARTAIPILTKGDKFYKIPAMNPMHIDSIELPAIGTLKLSVSNITVRGLDLVTPQNFNLNLQARNFTFQVFSPALEITGNYKLSGKLLVFPIEGEGFANITYIDGIYVYPMHYELVKKKNIEYIKIVEHEIDFTPRRAYFYFENLFNGNKVLGDQILQFMNENWETVNSDFGPFVSAAMDVIITNTANAILGKVPYDDVFLP